ncbi:hypothetical protein F4808DRAFT_94186 [Astrocystis sublimbata]|nr:hypothetical protein F4808DRAFT_94186 [Astrocystis sublimbata]
MKLAVVSMGAGIVTNASAALLPRPSGNTCCFGLSSIGMVDDTVEENHIGGLSLGGPFQQGSFCFDKSTKTIKDGLNHNCFMRSPTEQFQCYAGAVGATAFDIPSSRINNKPYLTYDGGPGTFYACPIGTGPAQYHDIFSTSKPNTTDCVTVKLALNDASAGCSFASNTTTTATTTSSVAPTTASHRSTQVREDGPLAKATASFIDFSQMKRAGLSSSVSPKSDGIHQAVTNTSSTTATASHTTRPSFTCSVSPSAPSIAPVRLGLHDDSSPDGLQDSSSRASISSHNSTFFIYSIPNSFLLPVSDTKMPLCALQFRMPVCTELPENYPCYSFSGLEQEFLAKSGMNFDLVFDDGAATWNGSALHQVIPGESTILGTFDCAAPNKSYGTHRKMSWHVRSVRNFSLNFLHAGVGDEAQFRDGIGAWIVPCH